MIKKYLTYSALALLLALLPYLGYLWHMERQGYCFEDERYLSDRELLIVAMDDAGGTLEFGSDAEERGQFLENYSECCTIKRTAYWWPFTSELGWGLYEVDYLLYGPYAHSSSATEQFRAKYPFGVTGRLSTACGRFLSSTWTEPLEQIPSWFQSR
jgi:hypothetical protein